MTSHSRTYILALAALLFLLPSATRAATLGLSPANVSITAGTSFTETVMVSSADQALNAVSGTLSFPANLLQVVSVSKASSILTLWVADPTFSNTDGTISFSGIVPNPGYIGSSGRIFSIQFRAKGTGTATIVFSSSSQVLANDGNGTDILLNTQPATITVAASAPAATPTPAPVPAPTSAPSSPTASTDLFAQITSSTHSDQTQWYKLSHAIFDWTNAQGVSAVRLGYDKNADGKPIVLYSDPLSHKELDLGDGIWYFHVQEKGSSGWGSISTYKVQIDTVSPLPFTLTFLNGTSTQSGSPIAVQFTATDELSGIDHYQLAIDGKESTASADEGSKPYAITADSGTHVLVVQVFDKAGNVTSAQGKFSVVGGTPPPAPSPLFTVGWLAINYLSLALIALAILGTLLFGAWYIRVHFSAYRHNLNHRLGLTHAHIHKEFDNLKDAITEEILKLEQVKSARALTREEERLVARFKKLLDQSEQAIEKEIEEIPG